MQQGQYYSHYIETIMTTHNLCLVGYYHLVVQADIGVKTDSMKRGMFALENAVEIDSLQA